MVYIDKNFISKKIKIARSSAKITQEELAEKIGITAKQLSRIETGAYMPSLSTFLKIVNILKIDLNEFGIKNYNNENPVKAEIDKILYCSTNDELIFYLEMVKSLSKNFYLLKK